jgi:hypothetical protein
VSATWYGRWDLGDELQLAATKVVFEGRAINVFLIEGGPLPFDFHRARQLRIHILRLHAEREYLRQIARLLANEAFIEGCGYAQIERMQYALNRCLATLTRAESYGFSTAEMATAFIADRTLSGAELEVLKERIEDFRPRIGKRLRLLQDLEDKIETRWRDFLRTDPHQKNFIYIQEVHHMSKYDQRGSQFGAAGDRASATNVTFGGQLNLGAMSPTDTEALQSALHTLRKHLADRLLMDSVIEVESEEISPNQIGEAIGALSEAGAAVAAKDTQRTKSALRRSGQWLAAFAQGVGVEVAATAIRAALGLP